MTYVLQVLDKLGVLVGNVLFHKGCRLEQLLAGLAAELPLVFLFNVRLACLTKLSAIRGQQSLDGREKVTYIS